MTATQTHSPYELARLADCASPDNLASPGAQWLTLVAGEADEISERTEAGEDRSDVVRELADSLVPIYTRDVWATFVDLAAYQEDVTEFGPIEDMEQAAKVALYLIAERLLHVLVDEEGE